MTAIPTDVFDVAVRVLRHARSHDATVLFVGNGGSASTASHFAADLAAKNRIAGQPVALDPSPEGSIRFGKLVYREEIGRAHV